MGCWARFHRRVSGRGVCGGVWAREGVGLHVQGVALPDIFENIRLGEVLDRETER